MIRPATLSDVPRLMAMGQAFADKARLVEHVGYDPENMRASFEFMIADDNCVILVGENGAIGGQKGPHPFNYNHWIAQELFWWSEGREGLRLLDAFEQWATKQCQSIRMITLESVSPERTGKLYVRRGYMPLEHGYIKVL